LYHCAPIAAADVGAAGSDAIAQLLAHFGCLFFGVLWLCLPTQSQLMLLIPRAISPWFGSEMEMVLASALAALGPIGQHGGRLGGGWGKPQTGSGGTGRDP